MSSELQIGIVYALMAGAVWGIGPLLLKRGMKYSNVSTATLVQQYVSVGFLALLGVYYGELVHLDFSSRAFWAFFLAGAVGAVMVTALVASLWPAARAARLQPARTLRE